MSTIYDRGRALTIRQLAPLDQGGRGQRVTLSYVIPGAYDENTQTTGPDTTVVQQCSGLEKSIDLDRVDGTLIMRGDSEFALSPVTVDGADVQIPEPFPALATLTLANGSVKTVLPPDPKRPSGLLIAVTLQLRA